jgi:hypothetical protein
MEDIIREKNTKELILDNDNNEFTKEVALIVKHEDNTDTRNYDDDIVVPSLV